MNSTRVESNDSKTPAVVTSSVKYSVDRNTSPINSASGENNKMKLGSDRRLYREELLLSRR